MKTKFTKIFAPSMIALSILAVGLVIIPAGYSLASAARLLGGGGGGNIDLGGGMTRGGGLHVNAGNGAHVGIGDLNLNAGGSQVFQDKPITDKRKMKLAAVIFICRYYP